ncbi:DUF4960 domain-containing protein [Flavobacterium aquiphilum]|uniref:DUF4960 domain-containing protein n=1 Tax=Flavobacterium aquiphilum TaxID=3003261 RepID=UPI0024818732|nr:DUF4960 domain-containing protein [Flavobacterium aquiphilum]
MKKVNKIYVFFIAAFIVFMCNACDERENYDSDLPSSLNIINAMKIGETSATIDNLSGVINVVLPANTSLQGLKLDIASPKGVTTSPANGTIVDLSNPLELKTNFNGKIRNFIINAKVLPNQIAFINEASSIEGIADDDIKAIAKWAQSTYSNDFIYIPFNELTIQSLAHVNVLLFYYDQEGSSALPQAILNKKNVITQFVVEGGKMLTGGMANTMIAEIGRDKSGLLTIKSNGSGGVNNDIWSIDGGVNFQNDQRNSPVFNFTTIISTDLNGYFPVINGGFKEDHNTMWDLGPLLAAGHQLGQFAEFQRLYGGKVLATWSGVTDEAVAGIIEFAPTSVYAGTIIGIGFGGMEWSMNDNRTNVYDANIKGIYRNSIDYLKTK